MYEGKGPGYLVPFGPPLGYMSLSDSLMSYLDGGVNESLVDYSSELVGNVREEVEMSEDMEHRLMQEVGEFVAQYTSWALSRRGVRAEGLKPVLSAGWIVRQYEGDHNPLHAHTKCVLSAVGYLLVPEHVGPDKDFHPTSGCIEFAYGARSAFTPGTFLVKPKRGDFFVFPSDLLHTVYPFRGEGERRSLSININLESA